MNINESINDSYYERINHNDALLKSFLQFFPHNYHLYERFEYLPDSKLGFCAGVK